MSKQKILKQARLINELHAQLKIVRAANSRLGQSNENLRLKLKGAVFVDGDVLAEAYPHKKEQGE